jgi:putative ABC transport system permease protein
MKFLTIVVRNLTRNRRRTLLTIVSIGVSIFVFATLMSLPALVSRVLSDQSSALRLYCHPKAGLFFSLPISYEPRIARVPHVQVVVGATVFVSTYRDPGVMIPSIGIDPGPIEDLWTDWDISPAAAQRFRSVRTAALVEKGLLRRYGWSVGREITLRGTAYPINLQLTIVGTIGGHAPPSRIIFRRDYLDEVLGRPGTANLFMIKVDRSTAVPETIAAIDNLFVNSGVATQTESEAAMALNAMGNYWIIFSGCKVLAIIVIVAIGLVAANTAAMAVRERRHEIAVMRSIGFTQRAVVSFFVTEGLLIGIAGGLLGCAIAYGALRMLPYAAGSLGTLALVIRLLPAVVVQSLVAAALIGLMSAIVPAVAATRREIAGELRSVA